jgi:anti-sigma regulatory factor (Ser/Thr protein kinase)
MEVATSSALLLPYTASSVGVARRRLIGDLTEAGVYDGTACDAGLVLSELISNALRHATPLPGRTVRVSWHLHQDSVEVAVSDGGGPTVPMVNKPSNWSLGGRGLGIVARLSLRWGVCAGDSHWDSDPAADLAQADSAYEGTASNGAANGGVGAAANNGGNGSDAGAHHTCTAHGSPAETTVWAELPVRYGTSASLVIASSRDA